MRLNPVDILANWYNDETLPWSAQKAVNCLAETAEVNGTRSVSKTKGLPGMTLLANLETGAPIRGAEDVEGTLFVVSGTSLFQINTDNSFTNRGNIPGVSLVSMAHNKQGGTTAANELVIGNGLSGYVYNTATTILTQITDDAFPGATTFDYVDGFISFTDPEGRFWGHSALNQATQYSSIDRYDAESAPDKIVSHIVSHREVMVFGTRTTEFFRNTGAATGTFQRVDGTEMEIGIAAPLARARLDNTVYWLGSDGLVYRLAGHSPQRVSTRPIEQAISRFNLANAFAHTWEDRGHQVFYLTFPDGLTFGYDVATSLWHARETYGLDRWGVNTTTNWNRLWVAGDYSNGKLYRLNWDDFTEDGRPLVMECQPGVTHADGNDVLCPYVELFMDTGQSPNPADLDPLTIQGDAPNSGINEAYSYAYSASGGFGIYTYSYTGTLPDGLTLSPGGVISGTTTATGSFSFTVTVTDSLGQTASTPDTIEVSFAANLLVGATGSLVQYSGVTTQYSSFQSIVLTGQTPTDLSTTKDGEFCTWASSNSPFFRLFKRNSLGAYIEVPTPLDTMPASTLQRAAISSDGTYIVTAQGTVWRLYKRNVGLDTYTLVNTIAGLNAATDMKFDWTTNYLAGCAPTGFAVYQIVADALVFVAAEFQGFNGIAWYGNRVASSRNVGGNGVWVWTLSGSVMTLVANAAFACPENAFINWTRDGTVLYMGGNTPTPRLRAYTWNGVAFAATADQTATIPNSAISGLDITQDGRVMAVTSSDVGMTIRLYEVNGAVLTLLSPTSPVSDGSGRAAFVTSADFYE